MALLVTSHNVEASIRRAAACLRDGGLVAFPTETVYGLGANAADDQAVASIFDAKARPRFNPLIVHVTGPSAATEFAVWTKLADKLATRFWPGPLSLILKRRHDAAISPLVSAGGETIALRAPKHPLAEALLTEAGLPIAAPSANPAGRISPTQAAHVEAGLGAKVDLILDGGTCSVGLESTVLDLSDERPVLLRPGGLAKSDIEAVIGKPILTPASLDTPADDLRSPGRLKSHYAPRHSLRLDAADVHADEALLAFGPEPIGGAAVTLNLSPGGDLVEAAANLFSMLHLLDKENVRGIAVMPIPKSELGEAIHDRLSRAAAPR